MGAFLQYFTNKKNFFFLEIYNKLTEITDFLQYFTNKKTSQLSPLASDNKLLANYHPHFQVGQESPSPHAIH